MRLIEDELKGEESKAMFEYSVVECAWILLSADTHSLSKQEAEKRIIILIQMAAGRYDGLQSLWKKGRKIQCNDENSVLRRILEELLSLSTSIDTIYPYKNVERALSDEFFMCRITGCIDKINTVLSAILEMSQDYAEFMAAQLRSWSHHTWILPCYGNEETFMILQRTGLLDPRIVTYSKMLSPWVHNNPPEVAVWQRYIDEGIHCDVLNWLLVSCWNARLSEHLVRLLIQEGANPNYASQNGGPSVRNRIIRPLEAAVSRREANSVYFLLECGADILAPCTMKGTLSGYAKSLDMTELANKLYLIESQERTKRNALLPSGTLNSSKIESILIRSRAGENTYTPSNNYPWSYISVRNATHRNCCCPESHPLHSRVTFEESTASLGFVSRTLQHCFGDRGTIWMAVARRIFGRICETSVE